MSHGAEVGALSAADAQSGQRLGWTINASSTISWESYSNAPFKNVRRGTTVDTEMVKD